MPVLVLQGEPGVFLHAEPPLVTDARVTFVVRAASTEGSEGAGERLPARTMIVVCSDPACGDPLVATVLSGTEFAAAASGQDGLLQLAWTDADGFINYGGCVDPGCTSISAERLDVEGNVYAFAITEDSVVVMAGDLARLGLIVVPLPGIGP